jgi:hypothetical protein
MSSSVSTDNIQDSSKRRLAPQVSFKQETQYETTKQKTSAATEAPKRVVIRYTREQIISMRKQAPILQRMINIQEVVTEKIQDPVCFEPLEPEDVCI